MAIEFFPGLSQNLSQLLDGADDYDIIIKVGENNNTKEFRAHSIILRARSPYFKRALSQNWIVKKNGMINFVKPNISPIVFEMIIRYMYTGVLDLKEKVGSELFDLLIATDELLMDELFTFIHKHLIKEQTEWLQKNINKVVHTAFQLENCKQLRDYCLDFICEEPEPFFNSPNFSTLEKDVLLELIKKDYLQIDEIKLWDYLIMWGIAQSNKLRGKNKKNISGWKNFLVLKKTLNQFILHIRFFEISSKDFNSRIWPYKKLLPETLVNDILSFHMAEAEPKLPSRHGKIAADSKIIKLKHAAILANWIQRKEANAKIPRNKKYEFNLIYCGSRDGYDINTMRRKCNKQGAIVVVIKIKENGTIIGGYNPVGWNCYYSSQWIITKESFIFSLGDRNNQNKISRVTVDGRAMYEAYEALDFGYGDLVIRGNSGTCSKKNYTSSILDTNNFTIEEIEIFTFIL